jgi:hypothetical protein
VIETSNSSIANKGKKRKLEELEPELEILSERSFS